MSWTIQEADLRYINMKFIEIVFLPIWNASCIMRLYYDKKLERQTNFILHKLTLVISLYKSNLIIY